MQLLKDKAAGKVTESAAEIKPLSAANVKILNGLAPVKLATGANLFSNVPGKVDALAAELEGARVTSAADQLAGVPIPASAWEALIHPARVTDYAPSMLDAKLS